MALFENFPYTNMHELNLDWLINVLNELKEGQVTSVNGQTGDVILYQNPDMVLPAVDQDYWSIVRMADGTSRGIMFGNNDIAYVVHGSLMAQIYSQNNQPPYPVTSVNGQTGDITLYSDQYVRLPALSDADMHNWNIFRQLNGVSMGIQFEDDGSAYIVSGSNRYKIYTANDEPDYPVDSVNGQTGDVSLFTDSNGSVIFPAITDPNVTGWILGRYLNNTSVYIRLDTDGRMALYAGNNVYRVYTTEDTEQDIVNIPTLAATSNWGLIRTTASGSVGIMFNNAPGLTEPSAYVRYVDSNNQIHTVKLLTQTDIPSSTGVVSVNGLNGVVVLTGSDIAVSSTDNRSIVQAFEDIKTVLAYVENGATATNNITAGSPVIWQNQAYIASVNIAIGDTLSSSNLTAVSAGGFIAALLNNDSQLNIAVSALNATTTGAYTVETNVSLNSASTLKKKGNIVEAYFRFTLSSNISGNTQVGSVPAAFKPISAQPFMVWNNTDHEIAGLMLINSSGNILSFGGTSLSSAKDYILSIVYPVD